jgi:5'-methylthioadenosine phosphorylase
MTEESVSVEMVIRTLMQNTALAQRAIQYLVENLVDESTCQCGQALSDAIITQRTRIPPVTAQKLNLLVGKYLRS